MYNRPDRLLGNTLPQGAYFLISSSDKQDFHVSKLPFSRLLAKRTAEDELVVD
jgi:hypothetical protein